MSPSGTSAPVSSPTSACSRRARTAPRVWMPTSAMLLGAGVLLDDLVSDPHQRAAQIVAVEDDLVVWRSCYSPLPGLSGPG